ncbi:hypothetical protein Zmor_008298 [Zophobas morio]|uniref:Uncharacterized protein n=1 Tax=Zophobas morio TaxID=2755281 RepID=A0AA38IXR3_9CUCU|nr:hypothetical protein Zmor_008298 [Zophobas morio]
MLFVLLSTITIPYSSQLVTESFDNLNYWEKVEPEVEKKIRREAKLVNLFLILYLTLVATSAILHMIPNPDDAAMFHCFMILQKLSIPMIALVMMTPYTQVIYCCKCWKFQNLHLLSALERIDSFEDNHDLTIVSEIQSEIKNKLVSCVRNHNNLQM